MLQYLKANGPGEMCVYSNIIKKTTLNPQEESQ